MEKWILFFVILWPAIVPARDHENRKSFFINLAKLDFEAARENATNETNSSLQFEMIQLADILFYEGQREKSYFKLSEENSINSLNSELFFIRTLNAGYLSLFYDRGKGDAYKNFYHAYQLAKELNNPTLIKASLLAFFKYYSFEIAQVSDSYRLQLDYFEILKEDPIDEIWLTIYKLIYYSKIPTSLAKLDDRYYELAKSLNEFEKQLNPQSPLLAHILYEKAIQFEIKGDLENCETYFKKVIEQAKDFPFLKDKRFSSFIKLLQLESTKGDFLKARIYLKRAKEEFNIADSIRSSHHLNLYSSIFIHSGQKKYDSAFFLLKEAYLQEFQLDFRRNTIEINRLNVELETQEKENANLKLRADRIWLITALAGVALLLFMSYLAYANQRSKNKIQLREKEMQALELEKMLKDQEVFGIDAMIEGQEKERQRIANDLHDNLGSSLATLKLHLQNIRGNIDAKDIDHDKLLQKTDDLLEETYQKVRGIAHAGNAGVNAQEGLVPAVKSFASKVSIINRLVIDVEEHGMNSRLENSLEITIFRIIQELITNVIKHANANHVVIHLTQHDDSINLMVEDNGIGLDLSKIKPSMGMGLYSIQKKIENIGGRVTIESVAQKGTTVIIDVPIT